MRSSEGDCNEVFIQLQGERISAGQRFQVAFDNGELPCAFDPVAGNAKYRDSVVKFRDIELAEL